MKEKMTTEQMGDSVQIVATEKGWEIYSPSSWGLVDFENARIKRIGKYGVMFHGLKIKKAN